MRRKTLYAMLALGFIANVYAQQPEWIRQKPPKSETYYYRIAQATADTEEKAYTKALIKTVCESAISTDFPVDMQQLMMMQEDSALIMLAREVNIPVNVVCQYSEKLVSTTGYKVYLLSQVSNKAGKHPKYNDFNCFTNKEED